MPTHMQVFEQDREELLPDVILKDEKIRTSVPYKYRLEELPKDVKDGDGHDGASHILEVYNEHIKWCGDVLGLASNPDAVISHNIVLTRRWLMTIPRREAGVETAFANAAGMIGLVWVSRDETVDLWKKHGPTNVLSQLGVPV